MAKGAKEKISYVLTKAEIESLAERKFPGQRIRRKNLEAFVNSLVGINLADVVILETT
jgi:hypothetical protein